MSPTLYLEDFYNDNVSITDTVEAIINLINEYEVNANFDSTVITNFDKCKERVIPVVISSKTNDELLQSKAVLIKIFWI